MTVDCGITEARRNFEEILNFVVYYIIMPMYFILGMSGNLTLLLAFLKQAKTDKAYAYQIFLTTSKACEILCSSIFWWGYKWNAGIEKSGHDWYMNSYGAMFWAAHVGCPLSNGFIVTSLLFSVAMTADRIFALGKPFLYKNINSKRHQTIAAILCVLIGMGTSIFEVRRWMISPGVNTTYILQFDEEYLSQGSVMFLGQLRTGVRLVSLVSLVVLNITMAVIFRQRMRKVATITAGNDKKEQERKVIDKQLLVLTIYNSCLMAFSHIPHSIYFVGVFASTAFDVCYSPIVAPFADGCICLSDAADIFIIVGLNRKMRRTVFRILPCCKNAQVGPTTVGGAAGTNNHSQATNASRMYGNA